MLENFWERHQTLRRLPDNSRFYILVSSLLISLLSVCLLRIQIPGDQLFIIRLEQVFGFAALGYWYVALLITPLQKVVGKKTTWLKSLLFARRAIGVSAAYFALLHIVIAIFGQLGGLEQLGLLPDRFKWSLGLGAISFLVLALMTATSFDKVIAWLTFARWKRIHRLGYPAGILIILHVWLIGTHTAELNVLLVYFTLLIVLFGLEAVRISRNLVQKYELTVRWKFIAGFIWLVLSGAALLMPQVISNYHQQRHGAGDQAGEEHGEHHDDTH